MLLLGERDTIVCNKVAKEWHQKTHSASKEIKVVAKNYHELAKEPESYETIGAILNFIAKRLETPSVLGPIDPSTIK